MMRPIIDVGIWTVLFDNISTPRTKKSTAREAGRRRDQLEILDAERRDSKVKSGWVVLFFVRAPRVVLVFVTVWVVPFFVRGVDMLLSEANDEIDYIYLHTSSLLFNQLNIIWSGRQKYGLIGNSKAFRKWAYFQPISEQEKIIC